jgi:hypothetical protein
MKLVDPNASFIGFHFFRNSVHPISSKAIPGARFHFIVSKNAISSKMS